MNTETYSIEKITSYSLEVAEAIKHLTPQIGHNYNHLITDEEIKLMLQSSSTHLYFARDEKTKQIVGMFTLIVYRSPYAQKCFLEDLIVDQNWRRKGIGTFLIQEAVKQAKTLGVAFIDFTSRPRRDANLFYEKIGFKQRESNIYRYIIDYREV